MISTIKSIDIHKQSMFIIPKKWRKELNIVIGNMVSIKTKKNHIIIQHGEPDQNHLGSIVGRDGTVYIPKEIRDIFHYKGLNDFIVSIDHLLKQIILIPYQVDNHDKL